VKSNRVATDQEIVWKKRILEGQGKDREFYLESGKNRQSGKIEIITPLIYWREAEANAATISDILYWSGKFYFNQGKVKEF